MAVQYGLCLTWSEIQNRFYGDMAHMHLISVLLFVYVQVLLI